MENGSLFKDTDGNTFIYTGEDGGVPDPNNKTTYKSYTSPTPIQKQTSEVLEKEDPSFTTDLQRTFLNVSSAPSRILAEIFESTGIIENEEEKAKIMSNVFESLVGAAPLPISKKKKNEYLNTLVDTKTGKIRAPETLPGQIVDVGTIMYGGLKAASLIPKSTKKIREFGRYLAGEQVAEQLLTDPDTNIANFITQLFPDAAEGNPVLDYLSAEEDDSILHKRAKMALSSGLLGASIGGGLELVKGGVYGASRVGNKIAKLSKQEADEVADDILVSLKDSGTDITSYKEAKALDDEAMSQILRQTTEGKEGLNIFDMTRNKIFQMKQRFFTSRGYTTKEGFGAKRQSMQNQRQTVKEASSIITQLKKFIDENIPSQGKADIYEKIQSALTDDFSSAAQFSLNKHLFPRFFMDEFGFDKVLADQVADARILVDDLSEKLLDSNVTTEATKEIIRDNIGSYMRRSYRLYEDSGYKPSDDVINNATNYIADSLKKAAGFTNKDEVAEEILEGFKIQAKNKVTSILQSGESKNFLDFINSNRANTKQILSQRKEFPDEIRALMGEIKDPTENILLTVSKMSSVAENAKYLSKMKELGKDKYIFSEQARNKIANGAKVFSARIKGTNTNLDGMYTTPEMKKVLEGTEEILWKRGNKTVANLLALKGFSQKLQTVFDHQSQIRNFIGGAQFGLANGMNPFFQVSETKDILLNQIGRGGNKNFDAVYQELQGLGVINTSVRAGEYRALLDIGEELGTKSNDILAKGSKVLEKLKVSKENQRIFDEIYMATDDLYKINGFYRELDVLKRAKPSADEAILKQEAADIIKNTFPNYDYVPPGIKALRELPVGNFFSFPSEIIRTSANIIRQSAKEISTGNKVLVDRGVNRLTGFVGNQVLWSGAGYASAVAAGLTSDEYEAINTLAETPYSKNHNKIVYRDGNKLYLNDPTFLDSYSMFREIASDLYRPIIDGELFGRDLDEALMEGAWEATKTLVAPYTGPTILTQAVLDLGVAIGGDGRIFSGRKLFEDNDTFSDKTLKGVYHLAKAVAIPGSVQDITKLIQNGVGSKYSVNPYTGKTNDLDLEFLANSSGIRFREFDLDDVLTMHSKAMKGRSKSSMSVDYQTVPKDIEEDFQSSQERIYAAHQDLYRQVQAYQDLTGVGSNRFKPYSIMVDAGLSKKAAESIFIGRFKATEISENLLEKIREKSFERDPKTASNLFKIFRNFNYRKLIPVEEEEEEREEMRKGGVVKDVPSVPEEPDERIDKMTGLPYNEQAGTAFIDEEDRADYTQGGKVLKSLKKRSA